MFPSFTLQHMAGVVVQETATLDWVLPLMYISGTLLIIGALIMLGLRYINEIDIHQIAIILSTVVSIAVFITAGILHTNMENANGRASIANRLSQEYGVKISPSDLYKTDIMSFIGSETVQVVPLGDKPGIIVRNSETGVFEEDTVERNYALIVDGRVIELVEVTKQDGKNVFTPLTTVK